MSISHLYSICLPHLFAEEYKSDTLFICSSICASCCKGRQCQELHFDQSRMCSYNALKSRNLKNFPFLQTSSGEDSQASSLRYSPSFVSAECQMFIYDTKMVACDSCDKWFHYKCVDRWGVTSIEAEEAVVSSLFDRTIIN